AAGIVLERKMLGKPGETAVDRFAGARAVAAKHTVVVHFCIALVQTILGNRHCGDAGTGHAAGPTPAAAVETVEAIPPRPVAILHSLPIGIDSPPGLGVDWHPDALGVVECQECELRVRVVAGTVGDRPTFLTIAPRSGERAGRNLDRLDPLHVMT